MMTKRSIKQKAHSTLYAIFMLTMLFVACSDSKNEEHESIIDTEFNLTTPSHLVSPLNNIVSSEFTTNIPITDISLKSDKEWCNAEIKQPNIINIFTEGNIATEKRQATITITDSESKVLGTIEIDQKGYTFDINILDKQIKASGITATSEEISNGNHPATNMIDGNKNTYFNSKFGAISKWPFIITVNFEGENSIDYMIYHPRYDTGSNLWGAFGELDLYIATEDNPELQLIGNYDFEMKRLQSSKIEFEAPFINVRKIELRVKSAYENRVSCSQLEFFGYGKQLDTSIFTDLSCSQLKEGTSISEIENMEDPLLKDIAQSLYSNSYNSTFRVQEYRPYQHPDIMAKVTSTNPKSLRDNPTGIYVDNLNEPLIVFMDNTKAENVSLNIANFENVKFESHALKPGINILQPSLKGLIYIYNHDYGEGEDAIKLEAKHDQNFKDKTVKIHFATGKVNGYFDIEKHDIKVWNEIIEGVKYGTAKDIDIVGKYTHIAWNIDDYRDFNSNIIRMIELFDEAMYEQMAFTGLVKYNKTFNNRFYLHINYDVKENVGAYATNYRTAYNYNGYADVFCTEKSFVNRNWVLGHEVGHSNQVRPGMKWHGTTEVTNNICAMHNQSIALGYSATRLLDENAYEKAINIFVKEGKSWNYQAENNKYNYVFEKLVPLWQLKLYFLDILNQKDFYKDVYEHARITDHKSLPGSSSIDGKIMLDFVKTACIVGQKDLTEFFEQWGFLRPFNGDIEDYGKKKVIITQQDINTIKEQIKELNLPKPNIGIELYYLSDTNYKNYSE